VADNAAPTNPASEPHQHGDLPDRLRVHQLAQALGSTNAEVIDALTALDGQVRTVHSGVDREAALRVRDLIFAKPLEHVPGAASAPVAGAASGPPAGFAENLPDRLRVHQLARALGSTNAEVIDALTSLDGQVRTVHAGVDREEALRVRDVIFATPLPDIPGFSSAPVPFTRSPESRPPTSSATEYMPLFVAPEKVQAVPNAGVDDFDDVDSDDADDTDDADESDTDDDQSERPASRRRRRGRRGRGRGRGEQGGPEAGEDSDNEDGADADSDADADDQDADDSDDGSPEAASRRRRRRRRRKSGSGDDNGEGSSPDDPPNTVVHERSSRSGKGEGGGASSSEIRGIDGSTRLEAKRQRRRDGRDAGRRRPPVLTEAEFLARREAVERVMVVRDRIRTEPPHPGARYTQIAVLEDGIVVEHFVTSAASASLVGNIYLGIVQNVLPSMEAAFVDIGRGRNGVLYAGEVNWEAAGLGGSDRRIEQALKPGDYVVVQVSKDPVGHKGARLTTQVSLAGRYLVYVPGASSTGISRKLPDTERQRLKEILREVVPADAGVIIRTASEGVTEEEIRNDVIRLQGRWNQIEAKAGETKAKAGGAAVVLYEEPDVLVKVIRDLFNEDFAGLIVSGDDSWRTIEDYVNSVAPELVTKMTKYEPPGGQDGQAGPDVFAVHRIDEQLAKAMDRKVWLPSGGTLVIDRTEAMTVVDVNTGKFTGSGGNLEQTVTKNNLEAAEEIVRQLRLRDIGGIIVIDFIDMVLESNRDLVLRRLTEALARDRTRHQVSEVTSLGLVQLTRKRLGTGLVEAFTTSCPNCVGRGVLLHADPVESTNGASNGRKAESGGRRGRRSKKGRSDESGDQSADQPTVAKVPDHAPGEHPMFKAMAAVASRGSDDAEESEESEEPEDLDEDLDDEEDLGGDEDLQMDDEDDQEDGDDQDGDDQEDGDDLDDEDDSDLDDTHVALEVSKLPEAREAGTASGRPPRRRAAGRPAGPPVHPD